MPTDTCAAMVPMTGAAMGKMILNAMSTSHADYSRTTSVVIKASADAIQLLKLKKAAVTQIASPRTRGSGGWHNGCPYNR